MKIKDVKILTSHNVPALEEMLKEALAKGWILYGNHTVTPLSRGDNLFTQMIVKEVSDD